MAPEDENVALKTENTALREQELETRLAKESHKSSKPPSSDGLAQDDRWRSAESARV
ncbi:MAG: DUF6444 domain-containing protein [Ktedonobacterales bacterium]